MYKRILNHAILALFLVGLTCSTPINNQPDQSPEANNMDLIEKIFMVGNAGEKTAEINAHPKEITLLRMRREDTKMDIPKLSESLETNEFTTQLPTESGDSLVDSITTPSKKKPSVLILIRDALKKVTTELPTEQVASNALHYFQLFEHFLQQTIEQVIGNDDDDEETVTIQVDSAEETTTYPELVTKVPQDIEDNIKVMNPQPVELNFSKERTQQSRK